MSVSEAEREDEAPAASASPSTNGDLIAGGDEPATGESVDGLTPGDRRRLRRAWTLGSVPMLGLYAWVLMAGRWAPFQRQFFDYFFDLQARSMMHGRFDIPGERVGFEGFVTGDKTYVYFGVVPSLLRMPLMAVTDHYDGRLTTLSMLLAALVLCVATYRLSCGVRALVRGAVPVGRVELWATAGLAVATLAAPPFFLVSAAIVYHEAMLWGLALTIASFDAVVRWQRQPTGRRLAVASAVITLAILSRLSVALGPLAALALFGAMRLWQQWRQGQQERDTELEPAPDMSGRLRSLLPGLGWLALAGLVPVVLSMAVNYAKFEQVVGVPPDRQVSGGGMGEGREKVLAEHSLYVSPEYLPTNLWQYFGLNGIEPRQDFPYIDFPRNGPALLDDDVVYDALTWCTSLPVSVPALCLLAIVGVVWAVRSRRQRGHHARIWPLLVGAFVGSSIVLVFAYVANRYLNDLYPLVLVPAIVGFHAAATAMPRLRPVVRRVALVGMAGLVGWAVVVNLALAMVYQRERGLVVPDDWRAEWVGWRVDLPGAPEPDVIGLDDALPPVADGGLLVVGDCDGLYTGVHQLGVADDWEAVERGPGVGAHDLRFDIDELPVDERFPLITLGRGAGSVVIGVVRHDDGTIQVDVLGPERLDLDVDGDGQPDRAFDEDGWLEGRPHRVDGTITVRVTADRRTGANNVYYNDRDLNLVYLPVGQGAEDVSLGSNPEDRAGVNPEFPTEVERITPDMSVCRAALDN